MLVRPATVDDAPAIAALHLASWQTHYRGLLADSLLDALNLDEWTARRRTQLADQAPGSGSWVLETDGRVVGWCAIGPSREAEAGIFELFVLYLAPGTLGRGFGRALLAQALAFAALQGASEVILWVIVENARARRFYAAAGFRDDARVPERLFQGARSLRMARSV